MSTPNLRKRPARVTRSSTVKRRTVPNARNKAFYFSLSLKDYVNSFALCGRVSALERRLEHLRAIEDELHVDEHSDSASERFRDAIEREECGEDRDIHSYGQDRASQVYFSFAKALAEPLYAEFPQFRNTEGVFAQVALCLLRVGPISGRGRALADAFVAATQDYDYCNAPSVLPEAQELVDFLLKYRGVRDTLKSVDALVERYDAQ